MRSGPHGDDPRRETRATKADVAQAEDFLFHLHRGSEMLLKNRVLEAKEELERALQHQPQDAKSQDLLAGVYFRLGVYPRAIEIWSSLVSTYPTDATLRVNLALAYFKTGQADDALEHVHGVLKLQPDHERAWGYLGLINWRRGHITEARDAFLRGGQASMARRMEELLAEDAAEDAARKAEEHRLAADDAARAIADRPAHPPMSPRPSHLPPPPQLPSDDLGASRDELGVDRFVPTLASSPAAVQTLHSLIAASLPPPSDPRCVRVGSDGQLSVRAPSGFCLRVDLAQAVVAASSGLAVHRRVGGIDASAIVGGEHPVQRFSGLVEARVRAPEGMTLHLLEIEDTPLFVVESRLVGFAAGLELESNHIPMDDGDLPVVRLHGRGEVVLLADAGLSALAVTRGRDARVRPSSLVAWSGAVFISAATGVSALSLVLRGEGAVLLA